MTTTEQIKAEVEEALKTVNDPELGIDIYNRRGEQASDGGDRGHRRGHDRGGHVSTLEPREDVATGAVRARLRLGDFLYLRSALRSFVMKVP
jgi:hypothetical protein